MAPTATERVYRVIREKIIRLELPPGELLVESKLAEQLGTGRTPVREALKMLACENLVLIVPQRGIYVAEITLTDLQEIAELRRRHKARIAEREIAIQGRIREAVAKGAFDEIEALQKGLVQERKQFDAELEEQIEAVRKAQ